MIEVLLTTLETEMLTTAVDQDLAEQTVDQDLAEQTVDQDLAEQSHKSSSALSKSHKSPEKCTRLFVYRKRRVGLVAK